IQRIQTLRELRLLGFRRLQADLRRRELLAAVDGPAEVSAAGKAARCQSGRDQRKETPRHCLLLRDLDATVLAPRRLVVTLRSWTLLAVAHDAQLTSRHATQLQRLLHRARATLAERNVVLAGAALVRVALEAHANARVRAQVLRPVVE